MFQKSVLERFVCADGTTEPAKEFYDPVQKSQIKTTDRNQQVAKAKNKPIQIADFMAQLESLVPKATVLQKADKLDCIVFDGMAVVQMLQPPQTSVKPT